MRYTLIISFILCGFLSIAQKNMNVNDAGVGMLKTNSGKVLGYAFVAMNENVVFTAAHNLSFDEGMVFETRSGEKHSLNIVATDQVGDIAVLMAGKSISKKPYGLNLNYAIDAETEIYMLKKGSSKEMSFTQASLKEKSSKIEKRKEFKSMNLALDAPLDYAGAPVLNAYNEVIGIVIDMNKRGKERSCKVSILDSDLWKKM